MPTHTHPLHAFDLRSVVLFTCLTMGGTSAVVAQNNSTAVAPAAPLQAITPSEIFHRADQDRNAQLSRAEAQHLPAIAEQFDDWDRDGNGQISLDEFLLNAQQKP